MQVNELIKLEIFLLGYTDSVFDYRLENSDLPPARSMTVNGQRPSTANSKRIQLLHIHTIDFLWTDSNLHFTIVEQEACSTFCQTIISMIDFSRQSIMIKLKIATKNSINKRSINLQKEVRPVLNGRRHRICHQSDA